MQQLDETFRYRSGVLAGLYGSDNNTDWFKVHRFDQSTYQDGLRIYRTGFYQWLPEPYGLEQVEGRLFCTVKHLRAASSTLSASARHPCPRTKSRFRPGTVTIASFQKGGGVSANTFNSIWAFEQDFRYNRLDLDLRSTYIFYALDKQQGLYLQDQVRIDDRWVLLGSVRYDDAQTDNIDQTNGLKQVSDDTALTWSAGAMYLSDRGRNPYLTF